ncbi:MAM and LDL-receptor class A domain-containing protein 1 [Aplysia californica]|uniref:MAM and LDL-receptor class A domain-containing protein 1 n=1 Tax=Aplysia californica TaxID=6500 RepID=A0ABM1A717_APLCA|nr:MAM and LDL-receptor class A domain-containing protein 1 [Aplysia californica]
MQSHLKYFLVNAELSSHCTFSSAGSSSIACDFETSSICGYKFDSAGNFNWTWRAGSFPATDHTTQTASGHFLVARVSGTRGRAQRAKLVSPSFPRSSSQRCLQFWYTIPGSTGSLSVVVGSPSSTGVSWSGRSPVNTWMIGQVNIPTGSGQIQASFTAQIAPFGTSVVAIDDVSIRPGQCRAIGKFSIVHQEQFAFNLTICYMK